MLSHLTIRNFTLIDALELPIGAGLSVVTGETGAGKSIVFDALALLLGARASTDLVRSDAEEGLVQGLFHLRGQAGDRVRALLAERGLPSADDELLVRRTLSRTSANRVFINDTPATVGLLPELMQPLVDLLGQHQHLTLVRPETHRSLLDSWGRLGEQVAAHEAAYREWRGAADALEALRGAAGDRAQRVEYLRFQCRELEALDLRAGEYDELEQQLQRARHAERFRTAIREAAGALYEGRGAAVERLGVADQALSRVAELDPDIGALAARVAEIAVLVDDVARDLAASGRSLESLDDVDALESRHELLRRAMRRHARDEEGLLALQEEWRVELGRLERYEDSLEEAERAETRTLARALESARSLDAARAGAAVSLFERLAELLERMAMPGARFGLREEEVVAGQERAALRPWGLRGVEIEFSGNPGEPLRPMGRIASGGELSRLMLAFKTAMMGSDPVDTCVFDEIDTGIGGPTGEVVGRLLRDLAVDRQVICVTHLPQIACFGEAHLRAEKRVEGGRTVSTMGALDEAARLNELGRMMGGRELTEATLAHARDMLRVAREGEG